MQSPIVPVRRPKCPGSQAQRYSTSWSDDGAYRGKVMGAVMPGSDLPQAARSLLLDQAAGTAVRQLQAAGIPSILLKGAAIATWLYEGSEVRPYLDVDLLVSPVLFEKAKEVLAELGYVHRMSSAHPSELGSKEHELFGPTDVCIDLHYGLLGVAASSEQAWDVLSRRTERFTLPGGAEVEVLDLPARAMHLALHAAQNGPIDVKALADLARGLTKVDRDGWEEAARLAEELQASHAFAAGLRLVPAGAVLADELSLTRDMTVELALRTGSAPQNAMFFERLARTKGARNKVALVARRLFPTTAKLRAHSGMARHGRLGLLRARIGHLVSVVSRLPSALLAWRAARRLTEGRQ